MTITAKIIADSISAANIRLTSLQLRYPRFIHSEFMTHRVFSRSASSSRAVPISRLIEDVLNDTAMPIHWGKNQPGMQANEEHNAFIGNISFDGVLSTRKDKWYEARDNAIQIAKEFDRAGYHKQIVNRLLEPFSHINVIVTSTEWTNFFELRDHPDAQPEFRELAKQIKKAMNNSSPILLYPLQWHLPYVTDEETNLFESSILLKLSTARCARVSYLTYENKKPDIEKDILLFNRLVGMVPLHASPAEHQATPNSNLTEDYKSNFSNRWIQHRKILEEKVWKK